MTRTNSAVDSDWINNLLEMGDTSSPTGCWLDVQALIDDRLLCNANSGGGKSRTLRKLIELAFGHAQIIVFDVEGEFHTLRERFPFTLAGPGGEAPATVKSAAKLADRLIRLGTSTIIDISDLKEQELFVANFLVSWMSAPRALWHDTILVLDEANKLCPEGKASGDLALCQEAIIDLMKRGRKRGFAGVLATQRLADLNKRAAAECNSVLLGRCAVDVDIDRSAKALGMRRGDANERMPALRPGEFFAYGRAILGVGSADGQRVSLVKIGEVTTTHPRRGQRLPVTPPPAKVKRQLAELSDIVEEAEQEEREVERLRARVAELEARPAAAAPSVDTGAIEKLEVQLGALQAALEQERSAHSSTSAALSWRIGELGQVKAKLIKIAGEIQDDVPGAPAAPAPTAWKSPPADPREPIGVVTKATGRYGRNLTAQINTAPAPSSPARAALAASAPIVVPDGLTPVQARFLTVLAQRGPTVKRKVLIYARNKRSGATDKAFAELVANGWVTGDPMTITAAGKKILGPVPPLRNEVEMSDKHIAFLSVLAYFGELTKRQVLLFAGYVRSGATDDVFAELTADEWITSDKGTAAITADGRAALGSQYVQPPTGRALLDRIYGTLNTMGREVLQTLAAERSTSFAKADLLKKLGRARSGATDEVFANLVRREYAIQTGKGEIRINPDLFKVGATNA